MKIATVVLLSSMAVASAASAQPSVVREPQAPPEVPLVPRGELALPPLPEPSARQERWVTLLSSVARRTLECDGYLGDREGEYFEDGRCYDWFESLIDAGPAGVHAMGRTLLEHAGDPGVTYEELRMIGMMGGSGETEAIPYLIHLVAGTDPAAERAGAVAVAANESLEQLTGVSAVRPATGMTVAYLSELVNVASATSAWTEWFAQHGSDGRRTWVATSLDAARALLESGDDAQRFWAIRELVDNGARRDVLPALRSLLSDPEVSAETRHEASRFARRQGLLGRNEVRSLIRQAQGAAI
jgi:hypothetical protein